MIITLDRLTSTGEATLGRLWVDEKSTCWTLEDQRQTGPKVPGETRIPDGTYEIRLRKEGGLIQKYRARYGDWHQGMLHLQNVPGFTYVYIHTGNTDDHTEGCILVGNGSIAPADGDPTIQASRDAYEPIARAVHDAIANGERVVININTRD